MASENDVQAGWAVRPYPWPAQARFDDVATARGAGDSISQGERQGKIAIWQCAPSISPGSSQPAQL